MYYMNAQVKDTAQPIDVNERNFPHIWNSEDPTKEVYIERRGNHIFIETLSNDIDYISSEVKKFERKSSPKKEEKHVCLDLQALFSFLAGEDLAMTEYGYEIERSTSGGQSDYYDLRKPGENIYRCCCGEECMVISRDKNRVRLLSDYVDAVLDQKDFFFDLSEEEYKIASGMEE